ncbi:MAG: type II toxin-antitoxin system PemK/MazF family toxin [Cyclobacteriaceae bacterium]|nr:type II toxin-antitoxin system PemK/MazF family toxin [Cyclobacteriaceae bacterium]
MKIRRFEVWLANLNPQKGTEAGKKRPVLIVQTNFLNKISHPSTIICPITSNVVEGLDILRVHLSKGEGNMEQDSDILIDQMRSIDNKRIIKKIGDLPTHLITNIKDNLKVVLDL